MLRLPHILCLFLLFLASALCLIIQVRVICVYRPKCAQVLEVIALGLERVICGRTDDAAAAVCRIYLVYVGRSA